MSQQRSVNLIGFLNARVEELRRLTPRALRTADTKSIHQARVTTRRLKAAIDLIEPLLLEDSRRSFTRVLRRLRRVLGPIRDVDVMLMHLEEYRKHRKIAGVVDWLAEQLRARRAELRREAARTASEQEILQGLGSWWAVELELTEAPEAPASLAKRAVPRQLRSFVQRADRLCSAREGDGLAQGDVHELRIDGKLLRYTLELAAPLGFGAPMPLLRAFKQLQDALGLWHDYVVLGEQTLRYALDQQLPLHNSILYGQALDLADRCWRQSERSLERFVAHWKKNGELIRRQVLEAFEMSPSQAGKAQSASNNGYRLIAKAPSTAKSR